MTTHTLNSRHRRSAILAAVIAAGLLSQASAGQPDLGEGHIICSLTDNADGRIMFQPKHQLAFAAGKTGAQTRWLLLTEEDPNTIGWLGHATYADALAAWCKAKSAGFVLVEINPAGGAELLTQCIAGVSLEVQVGGPQVADRNLFADLNAQSHIELGSGTRQIQILNNWFGLDRDGSTDRGAASGVFAEGKDAIIKSNRFANTNIGVSLSSVSAQGNRIQSNIFGVTPAFVSAPLQTAVRVTGGSNNVIGAAGDHLVGGNSIFNCTAAAIAVSAVGVNPTLGARIRGNRIINSTGLDIVLAAPGPTANDVGDLDEGPNRTMNHPVLMGVSNQLGISTVIGAIDTLTGVVVIDLYQSSRCGSFGRGEASSYLGQRITSNGSFSFALPLHRGAADVSRWL